MYGILYTQGEMSRADVFRECHEFAPILAMNPGDDEPWLIPLFQLQDVADKFARRNLIKNSALGTISLSARDVTWLEEKGYTLAVYTFPRKLKDFAEFEIVILEYDEPPEFAMHQRRK